MEKVLYQDSNYKIYEDPSEGLLLNYRNSCKYKVASNEVPVIKYLCAKIAEVSEKK